MAKQKITELVAEICADFFRENGLELYHCEFVKEGRDWFLRVYIDKASGPGSACAKDGGAGSEGGYISTDDCELASRFLSEKLDELDPIAQNYYLEVSSPGMDRTLYKPEHYAKYVGALVEVSLYRPLEGQKNFTGTLTGLIDDEVVIRDDRDKEWKFPAEQVAKTCLAVVF